MKLKMSPYYVHLIKSPLYGQELVKILINQESSETVLNLHQEVYSNFQNLDQSPEGISFEVKSYPILSTSLTTQLFKKLPVPLSKKIENFYLDKNSFDNFETLIEKTNSLVQTLESLEKEYQNIGQKPIIPEEEPEDEPENESEDEPENESETESVSSFEILESEESTDKIVDLEDEIESEIKEKIEIEKEEVPEKSLFDEMNELISDPKVDLDSCMKFTSKIFSKAFDKDNSEVSNQFGKTMDTLLNGFLGNSIKSLINPDNLKKELKDDLKLDQNGMSLLSPDEIMNLPSTTIYSNNFLFDFTNSPLNLSQAKPEVLSVQELNQIKPVNMFKKTSDNTEQRFEDLLQERNQDPRIGSYTELENKYGPHPGPLDYNRNDHHYLQPASYGDNDTITSQVSSSEIINTYRPLIYSVNPEKEYQICLVKSKLNHQSYVLMSNDISEYIAKSELFPELEFKTVYLIPNKDDVKELLKIQLKLVGLSLNSDDKLEEVITRIKNFLNVKGTADIIKIGADKIKKDQIDRLIVRFINQKCFKTTPYGNYCEKTSVQDLKNAFRSYLDLIDMSLHITITFDHLASWLSKYGYQLDIDGKYKMKLKGIEKFNWNGIVDQRKLSDLETISSESQNIRNIIKMSNHEKVIMI